MGANEDGEMLAERDGGGLLRTSGGDNASNSPSPSEREDAALNGGIKVLVNVDDPAEAQRVLEVLRQSILIAKTPPEPNHRDQAMGEFSGREILAYTWRLLLVVQWLEFHIEGIFIRARSSRFLSSIKNFFWYSLRESSDVRVRSSSGRPFFNLIRRARSIDLKAIS